MGNYLKNIVRLALIAVLVMAAGAVQAFPYELGDYKVDVTIRNAAMNLVGYTKVALYRQDKATMLVEVSAKGYKTLTHRLTLNENQFLYKIDLVLADLDCRVHVVNHNNQLIASAYVRLDQYGFPSDHFGITAYIPIKEWPAASKSRVDVFDDLWCVPLKKTCKITQIEEFYCVKLSMTRKSFKWSGKELLVTFKTNVPASPAAISSRYDTLQKIAAGNSYPSGCEESLAEYLCKNFAPEELDAGQSAMPASLAKLMQTRDRFAEVHREVAENF